MRNWELSVGKEAGIDVVLGIESRECCRDSCAAGNLLQGMS